MTNISKPKNRLVFVFASICLLLFLTSCSEQQFILSPELETAQTITTPENTFPFPDTELYPLDGEVVRKGNVTTVKPKNKISHKEFIESLPYEVTEITDDKQKEEILSYYKKSLNKTTVPLPPCNTRVTVYTGNTKYDKKVGRTIGCWMDGFNVNNVNHLNQLNNFKNNYGVSQLFFINNSSSTVPTLLNHGWSSNQLIAIITSVVNSPITILNVAIGGYYMNKPFELYDCDFVSNNNNYIHPQQQNNITSIANRANPLPVYLGTNSIRDSVLGIYSGCSGYSSTLINFYPAYNAVVTSINNPNVYIMNNLFEKSDIDYSWNLYKRYWPTKNISNFVHFGHNCPDVSNGYTKWNVLLKYADTAGINNIVLYGSTSEMTNNNAITRMHNFCNYAFQYGFISKFINYMFVYERCDVSCTWCQLDPDMWYVYEVAYSDWEEVFK